MFSAAEILDIACRIERNGEKVYRDAAQNHSNPQLVSLLEWMADEERKHAKWFSELKKKVETQASNPFVDEMSRDLFADILGEKSFSHRDVDLLKIEQIEELLAAFIEFEEDTVLFYQTLEPFIEDDDTLNHLKTIINEEKNHIAQIREFVESSAEQSAG
jgi:rubrerythrin